MVITTTIATITITASAKIKIKTKTSIRTRTRIDITMTIAAVVDFAEPRGTTTAAIRTRTVVEAEGPIAINEIIITRVTTIISTPEIEAADETRTTAEESAGEIEATAEEEMQDTDLSMIMEVLVGGMMGPMREEGVEEEVEMVEE